VKAGTKAAPAPTAEAKLPPMGLGSLKLESANGCLGLWVVCTGQYVIKHFIFFLIDAAAK
jgi:hypothetical protein